jgi:hypothetical protein
MNLSTDDLTYVVTFRRRDIFPPLPVSICYYVCAVYCGFVPTGGRNCLNQCSRLYPQNSNEFEAANSYLESYGRNDSWTRVCQVETDGTSEGRYNNLFEDKKSRVEPRGSSEVLA